MNQFNAKIKTSYDNIADTWFEKREWYIEQPSVDELIAHLHPGATILDVGCGSGKPIAAYLIEKGFDVYGVDISPKLLKYAERIIPKDKLFLADICNFKTDTHFDAIVCWFALFHIHASKHLEMLKRFHSFLKPKGILLITFADTSHAVDMTHTVIDEYTIESDMFGERFYHSGHPTNINCDLVKQAEFEILMDKIDQPGNQVILAKKK
ncbi:class I SAM-dependent methyltransferase [Legionella nagasakiensis]|uniref:class I SAM-dependent methyltransferase n=1 Tax=Legionella nagasakiensis TaxID=535290 RepID=UPI0010565818|nr:class I SAM-dependent methyltransferase [Legionella nagasakiensis]